MTYRPYDVFVNPSLDYIRTNNTGVTINAGTPVRINSSGDPDFVDPAIESQILGIAGVAQDTIPNGEDGSFITSGRVKELSTSFDFGDNVYISKAGGLTNEYPSEGVAGFVEGDFIVRLGVVARNEQNPTLKDLILHIDIIGQI